MKWPDFRYPVGKLHEDEFLTYKLLYVSRRIAFINEALYIYSHDNKSSITAQYGEKNFLDTIDCVKDYFSWSRHYAPEMKKLIEYMGMNKMLGIIKTSRKSPYLDPQGKGAESIKIFIKENVHNILKNPYATKKDKWIYFLWLYGHFYHGHFYNS